MKRVFAMSISGIKAGCLLVLCWPGLICGAAMAAEEMDTYVIGSHGTANLHHPDWIKTGVFDLRDDLADARVAGKQGVIVFFSQRNCSHCQAFVSTTLSTPDIKQRVQKNYDVILLDIFNDIEITGIDGHATTIKDFAQNEKARFTPTLVFYGIDKTKQLRLVGFYPPEKFRQVLDYLDGKHYRNEKLDVYLQRITAQERFHTSYSVDPRQFLQPPINLQQTLSGSDKPMMVIFDRQGCPACTRFYRRVLMAPDVTDLFPAFHLVYLDRQDTETKLVDPKGRTVTPAQWTRELELGYEPSVLFFDTAGNEVHRIDAECGKDRMSGSMQYVLEGAYKTHEQFLRWRREKAIEKRQVNQ